MLINVHFEIIQEDYQEDLIIGKNYYQDYYKIIMDVHYFSILL
jgi:hypothetical protein